MNSYKRRVVIGLGLVAGVVLVVAYRVHFRARWAVERYERQLLASGETLTVGPLVPPPILPRNNGAPMFDGAMGSLIWRKTLLETNWPPSMRIVAPGRAMVGWAQPDVRFDEKGDAREPVSPKPCRQGRWHGWPRLRRSSPPFGTI